DDQGDQSYAPCPLHGDETARWTACQPVSSGRAEHAKQEEREVSHRPNHAWHQLTSEVCERIRWGRERPIGLLVELMLRTVADSRVVLGAEVVVRAVHECPTAARDQVQLRDAGFPAPLQGF